MNKPLTFPFGFFVNDNTPDSGRYFNRLTKRPYADMAEALALLPEGIRHEGLVINIAGVDYWWPPNDSDLTKDPVVKEQGGISLYKSDKTYSKDQVVLYPTGEDSDEYTIYISKLDNNLGHTPGSAGDTYWAVANAGAFVTLDDTEQSIDGVKQFQTTTHANLFAFHADIQTDLKLAADPIEGTDYVFLVREPITNLVKTITNTEIGGLSSFADLSGDPMDNTALAEDLNRIEGKADVAQEDIDALELTVAGKEDTSNKSTDGTLADNSDVKYPSQKAVKTYVDGKAPAIADDTETQAGTIDNKAVSPLKLKNWWIWVKTQAQTITNTWSFTKGLFGTTTSKNAHLVTAASTTTLANQNDTWGAEYTGTESGAQWLVSTDYRHKRLRGTNVDEYVFFNQNLLLSGTGVRVLTADPSGGIAGAYDLVELYAYDSDVITAITGATYTSDRATITPANSKVFEEGQKYDDGTYTYEAIDNNVVRRY